MYCAIIFSNFGMPSSAILTETKATNTGENVAFSLPILEHEIGLHQIDTLIAVGKLCSSRRYLMTLQRHWPEVIKMLLPISLSSSRSIMLDGG